MSTKQILQKKLKAIVFTDIADFTSISAKDEQKAVELIQKQNEIIKPIVEKHNGEWLKEIGDGLLFSFDSSLEAVRCSIEIQETLKVIEDLNIRIGIHQGDIFVKDGDVYGDDVNIASRVEGFAPIGGISLSAPSSGENPISLFPLKYQKIPINKRITPTTIPIDRILLFIPFF